MLLLALMTAFAAGNFASALASDYGWLVVLRFLTGLPHGAYFGVASLVAADMAQPNQRARAVGRVMLGLTVATLLGVPLAPHSGRPWDGGQPSPPVGAIGSLAILLIWRFIPAVSADADASPLRELGALRRLQVWLTLASARSGRAACSPCTAISRRCSSMSPAFAKASCPSCFACSVQG